MNGPTRKLFHESGSFRLQIEVFIASNLTTNGALLNLASTQDAILS